MSPERSNSPQGAVLTPKMSVPASPVAGTPIREAQSPISLLLAVAQSQNRHGDDDLTSLSWLHEGDLLKGMNINPSPANSINSTPIKYSNSLLNDQFPISDFIDDSSISTSADSSSSSLNSPVPSQNAQKNKHPHNIPYDPLIHTNNKPPYSFSCLIFMAIEDSIQKALPVKEIYQWILEHFPYFKNAPTGWKNSVRHNLSLNKCFQKVEKAPNLGKGSLWTVDPQFKPNLIQALTRSPFHPCSTLDPSVYFSNKNSEKNYRLPNPDLYPYLSKKLASTDVSDESLDDVDAAAVMLSLKNGSKCNNNNKLKRQWQIITSSPSQDHTYSAADNGDDEAFESDEERSHLCRKLNFEDEEERKIKEGAETLLNLAGVSMRKHHQNYDFLGKSNCKKIKLSFNDDEQKNVPFKPRLLRTKKKDAKIIFNNNNNNEDNDEWVKHRRELEINLNR